MDEAGLAEMCSAIHQTLQDLSCSTEDCKLETSCCGTVNTDQQERSLISSRRLEGYWQVEYSFTETFTCEVPSCDAVADTAALNSIMKSVADPVSQALKDDSFKTVLASKVDLETLAVSPTCLVAWGALRAPGTQVNGGSNNDGSMFYPDWKYDSGTCLKDGEEPGYMRINPTEWLCDTLEECCERYYSGYNKNKCINEQGSGLWYVDHLNKRCVVDCDESSKYLRDLYLLFLFILMYMALTLIPVLTDGPLCGGIATPLSEDLYADPKSCCEDKLGWIQSQFCEVSVLV